MQLSIISLSVLLNFESSEVINKSTTFIQLPHEIISFQLIGWQESRKIFNVNSRDKINKIVTDNQNNGWPRVKNTHFYTDNDNITWRFDCSGLQLMGY